MLMQATSNPATPGVAPAHTLFNAEQLVILVLTLPLWTLATIYLLLLLIIYLKSLLYFKFYDRCDKSTWHFRYDIELIVGKESHNFIRNDSGIIFDLLDNHQVSIMTIQVPNSTVFRDNQLLSLCKWACSPRLKKVSFSVFRKGPLKEIKAIRVAHSSSDQEARLLIYGLKFHDVTNNEVRFFPINSIVRHRSTQWALNTSFELNNNIDFGKMGADIYDPFYHSTWPTYFELLMLLFFIWSSVFFFAYVISTSSFGAWELHSLVVFTCSFSSASFIGLTYLLLIKQRAQRDNTMQLDNNNINNINHSSWSAMVWPIIGFVYKVCIILLSFGFVMHSLGQRNLTDTNTILWIKSSLAAGLVLSFIIILIYIICRFVKIHRDRRLLSTRDDDLMKTNSKPNLFDPTLAPKKVLGNTFMFKQVGSLPVQTTKKPSKDGSKGSTSEQNKDNSPNAKAKRTRSDQQRLHHHHHQKRSRSQQKKSNQDKNDVNDNDKKGPTPVKSGSQDNLETGNPMSDNMYIKTKNRNSISQYI